MFSPDGVLSRVMTTIFDLIVVGILWVVCSLPIITIGISTTCAYYTMSKVVRHHEGKLLREFFTCFKNNFLQALWMNLIFLVIVFILALDLYYIYHQEGNFANSIFIVLVGISAIYLGIMAYYPAFLSRFAMKNFRLFKTISIASFKFLPVTALMLVVFAVMVIGIYLMPWAVFIFPGLYLFIMTFPMEYVLKKFMKKPEEGDPEADKWYYK